MKNKKWLAAVMMLVFLVFAACDDAGQAAAETSGLTEMEAQAGSFIDIGGRAEEAGTGKSAEGTEELIVYRSNGKADGLETEIHRVGALTPEEVINCLSKHNIVSMDTKVLGFEVKKDEERGRTVLELDLSKAFGEYLRTMGKDSEEVVLSALANTFLENYQADGILLTVEGKTLETAHGIYGGELIFKELTDN